MQGRLFVLYLYVMVRTHVYSTFVSPAVGMVLLLWLVAGACTRSNAWCQAAQVQYGQAAAEPAD